MEVQENNLNIGNKKNKQIRNIETKLIKIKTDFINIQDKFENIKDKINEDINKLRIEIENRFNERIKAIETLFSGNLKLISILKYTIVTLIGIVVTIFGFIFLEIMNQH